MSTAVPWGVVAVPYEKTTSYHSGAALGPAALLRSLRRIMPLRLHPLRIDPVGGRALENPRSMMRAAASAVLRQVDDGLFPVMFGGEHTCTLGPVSALRARHRKLGVVHLDAHADERPRYEGSRYSHACVMRRVSGDFGLPVLSVGVRALSAGEARYMKRRGVGMLPGEKLTAWRELLPPLLSALPRKVHLTVDMDFFDPAVAPGVGTPEPGGAHWHEAEGIIGAVTAVKKVVALDIVELCPPREREKSVRAALRTVRTVLEGIGRSVGD